MRFRILLICFAAGGVLFPENRGADGSGAGKLDPLLRMRTAGYGLPRKCGTEEPFPVLIHFRDETGPADCGVALRAVFGDVATASVTESGLEQLVRNADVLRIASPGNCHALLDRSRPAVGADAVHRGEAGRPFTGTGVIVGIYDSGIDWSHPDFIRPDGTSRILFLWDQTLGDGPSPSGFGYGTEYTQSGIDEEIASPAERIRSRDGWGHGTHVAGIAAGSGRATGNGLPAGVYVGIAPDADLIVVKGDDYGTATDDRILDGLDYIFRKAGALNRPAVANLSLGKQQGPHDGTSVFERGVENLLGGPGRAVVVAAGNGGDKPIHALADFASVPDDTLRILLDVEGNPAGNFDYLHVEGWFPPDSDFRVVLRSPGGTSFTASPGGIIQEYSPEGGLIYIDHTAHPDPANGDKRLFIRIADREGSAFPAGRWRILLAGDGRRVDLWLYETTVQAAFASHVDYSTLLAEPGNARGVITAGSYTSRIQWQSVWGDSHGPGRVGALSSFSSPGPTRPNYLDNNPSNKPEITAPGETVLSSLAQGVATPPADHDIAADGVHRAWAGTSMAAPHVTGLIALLFEADPDLTAAQITGILFRSARRDAETGATWNASWGFGKLDAFAAVALTGVPRASPAAPPEDFALAVYPNPFNDVVTIVCSVPSSPDHGNSMTAGLALFDPAGRLVWEWKDLPPRPGVHAVRWDARNRSGEPVAAGVYVAVLRRGDRREKTKLVYLK